MTATDIRALAQSGPERPEVAPDTRYRVCAACGARRPLRAFRDNSLIVADCDACRYAPAPVGPASPGRRYVASRQPSRYWWLH